MSVTSSVYDYRFENGRRYHAYAEGKYPVPNDEVEKDRLDLQHHAFRLTLDGALYRAPISKNVQDVLDVGTGTGIWAIEFAEEHPSANVLGTDLSPIQPTEVPPNCSFLIDDCDNEWVFRQQFDFIHTRAMVAAIKDWARLFEQAYINLKPGGYLECQEITFPPIATDPSLTPENSPLLRWSQLFGEAAAKIGLDHQGPRKFAPLLRAQGFVDIHAKQYNWPVGRWAKGEKNKLLGRFVLEDLNDWLPSSALALFTRILKWSREEVELFLASVRQELKDKTRHFYAHIIVWYAKKPENPISGGSTDDFVMNNEEVLESDDDKTVRSKERQPSPVLDDAVSPGALADDAADLSLASPKHQGIAASSSNTSAEAPVSPPKEAIEVEAIESAKQNPVPTLAQGPTSKDAFIDSVISLAPQMAPSEASKLPAKDETGDSSSISAETSSAPPTVTSESEGPRIGTEAIDSITRQTPLTEPLPLLDLEQPQAPTLRPDFATALGPTSLRPDVPGGLSPNSGTSSEQPTEEQAAPSSEVHTKGKSGV